MSIFKRKDQETAKKSVAKEKTVAKPVSVSPKTPVASVKKACRVLLKPIISEKATIGASLNQYTFAVAPDANKITIKKAIEEVYGIKPESVKIIKQRAKTVRSGRTVGLTKGGKKAIVIVPKGKSIKLYEGI